MTPAVESAFGTFIGRITASPDAVRLGQTRAERIVNLLKPRFAVQDTYHTGSLFRGTALPNVSDADVIVALETSYDTTPRGMMEEVQKHLSPLHRGTQVRKDGQALTLHFETWPNVDLVVARKRPNRFPSPAPEFEIADATYDRWLPSFPRKHDQAMQIMSEEHLQLIRMIKMWNHLHSEYLTSFHIEAFALAEAMERRRNCGIYPPPKYKPNDAQHGWTWATLHFFMKFLETYGVSTWLLHEDQDINPNSFSRVMHPIVEIGRVDDYLYGDNKIEALRRVRRAFRHSTDAFNATYPTGGWGRPSPDEQTAIDSFRLIFGEKFPALCPV